MSGPEGPQRDGPTFRTPGPAPPEAQGALKVNVETAGDISILSLTGKLTLGGGDRVLREATDMLLASEQKQIVLNMLDVSVLDSAGVGEIVSCRRKVTDVGGNVKLAVRGKVLDTFRMTRLDRVFDLHDDVDSALVAFAE